MSAAEIIQEPPELTADERAIVRARLRELEEQDEVQFLNDSTLAMFQDLHKQSVSV